MSTPSKRETEARLIAALRCEAEHRRDRERARVYGRLGASLALGALAGTATTSAAEATTGVTAGATVSGGSVSPGLAAAAGAASSAGAAATGAAATGAAATVLASAHPALMLFAGAAIGVGVMTGVAAVRESPSASPSAPAFALASPPASVVRIAGSPRGSTALASRPLEMESRSAAPSASSSPGPGPATMIDAPKAPLAQRVARAAPSALPPLASLADQQVLLDAARRALARSDGAGALEALSWHRARFPETAFGEEREALTIKALRASGSNGEARQRAEAFVRRYPTSVFQEGVVEPPNP